MSINFIKISKENPYKGNIYLDYKGLKFLPFNDIPKYINGDFYCDNNNLTSLKFAPEYLGEDFICYNNNIPKEEVERYWKTGAVKGTIYSDYGNYEPYKK